ncbi:MAG: Dabb family protein [Planctomycetaceae bacterium]|nr:Dabb family protein [Planctomycetaceae bacterium]
MKRHLILLATLALFIGAPLAAADPQLAHMVFFTLAEDNAANRETLVKACQKYLGDHDGTVYFSAGSVADDLTRDVNDREFDVALHLVFANKAAHDTYQTHPQHLKFIEENKHLWSGVRVFDSYLPAPSHDALPIAAKGFSGMLQGKVVAKADAGIIVAVEEITNVWQRNKAEEPKALVGKKVLVMPRDGADQTVRFVQAVEVGEALALDVGNREGDSLIILELSQDQRGRIGE